MFVRVQEATSRADREEIFRFRYRVYVEELKKPLPNADHDRKRYTDEYDEFARILVAFDENEGSIVGTVRTLFGGQFPFPDALVEKLSLGPMVDTVGMEHITHSGMFMVDPAYRGLTIASQLVAHMYRQGFQEDSRVDVCFAELALVRPYYQMGYRPFAPPFRAYEGSGLRVPLAWTLRDRDYLSGVGSPFAGFLTPEMSDDGAAARAIAKSYPEFRSPRITPQKIRAFWSSVAHSSPAIRPLSLFEGIEEASVESLLTRFPTLSIQTGEHLYHKGEQEQGMALLLGGRLGVTLDQGDDPFYFSVLMPGELVGEMVNYLPHGRSASLVALEDTELLLLPHDLLDKVERKQPELAKQLGRNLTALLASRLDAMNHRVVGLSRGNPERVRMQPLARDEKAAAEYVETSYSIKTLGDSEAELVRLEKQAALGQELEAVWFKRVGFVDGSTIIDLGCGSGTTSLLLARVFPGSRIIGVEPDETLRERARARVDERGQGDRFTFVDARGASLPLDDDSADFMYSRFVFQHLGDPGAVLREVRRVLRPGGIAALLDVDDAGIVLHPEPEGFADFQTRVAHAQSLRRGDRHVGRKLCGYLDQAGFERARTDVVPLSSHVFPVHELVDVAFSFKSQTLRRDGSWRSSDEALLQTLQGLAERDDAWIYLPIFLAHGRVP